MTDKYFILDIIQSEDDLYGEVAIIRANPVEMTPNGRMFASESFTGAEYFFLPLEGTLIQSIIAEQRQSKNGLWNVNPNDFKDEYIFNESENRRHLIHRHVSFFDTDMDYTNGYDYIEIPDMAQKCASVRSKWKQSPCYTYTSLRDYILELATEGDIGQFWGWLFGDDSLLDLIPEDLDDMEDKYTNALAEFIGFCEASESLYEA